MIETKSVEQSEVCSINTEVPTTCETLYAHLEVDQDAQIVDASTVV